MQIVHQKLPEACNSLGNSDHVTKKEMVIENVSDQLNYPCFLQGCKRIFLDNPVFIQTRFSKRNILS